jgi:hypothetical protein
LSDFIGITIKEAYEKNPKIKYPMITIEEIDNSEAEQYSSNLGEEFSNLSYQINIYSRDISSMQANEAVRVLGEEVNKVLGENLKMVRLGSPAIMPLPSDNTILQYSIRYSCVFDIKRNIIYKN